MTTVKTYLNTLPFDELKELLQEKPALFWELKQYADEMQTQWELEEYGANIPWNELNDCGYGAHCNFRLACRITPDYVKVADWLGDLSAAYDLFYDVDGFAEKIAKVKRYAETMRENDCGYINASDKDYEYMEKYCDEELNELLSAYSDFLNSVQDQFSDEGRLADFLLYGDELDRYYMDECKNVWVELKDRKIA